MGFSLRGARGGGRGTAEESENASEDKFDKKENSSGHWLAAGGSRCPTKNEERAGNKRKELTRTPDQKSNATTEEEEKGSRESSTSG